MTDSPTDPLAYAQPDRPAPPESRPRIWPGILLVILFWGFTLLWNQLDITTFTRFLVAMGARGLLLLAFVIWWLTNRRISRRDRWMVFGVLVVGGVVARLLSDRGLNIIAWLIMAVPIVLSVWAGALLLTNWHWARARRTVVIAGILLAWGSFTLIRMDGLNGDTGMSFRFRWTPTAEDLYRAQLAKAGQTPQPSLIDTSTPLHLQSGDWPGFRGAERDGIVHGTHIATDWNANPPKPLWRKLVGPGWSCPIVVNDRVFSQEQRGDDEAVFCLDAATGRELWAHLDRVRFDESMAGPGPRATPTFADGKLYTQGATGILNCLDAASGRLLWTRQIRPENAGLPMWGYSSSPLLAGQMVIVFEGENNHAALLAFHADTGAPAWTCDVGTMSYSSAQLVSMAGQDLALFLSDRGLSAVDPRTGNIAWEYRVPAKGTLPRSLQPHSLGDGNVLFASEGDLGLECIDVKLDGMGWHTSGQWQSRAMKPSFNEFVVYQRNAYGFDGGIFCCVDLQTGSRRWKQGRYDHGQVLLLEDQALLLVTSEEGEVILVAADPGGHHEFGRFQAVSGKTWCAPALAGGRLFVRSEREMGCYQLP